MIGYTEVLDTELAELRAAAAENAATRSEIIDKLRARISYYESTLCVSPPRPWQTQQDAVTGVVELERVTDVIAERDALRAEVARLRAALSTLCDLADRRIGVPIKATLRTVNDENAREIIEAARAALAPQEKKP